MRSIGLLLLFGGFLFLMPAATIAKIKLFTDSQGKVHITNQDNNDKDTAKIPPLTGHSKDAEKSGERPLAPGAPPSPPAIKDNLEKGPQNILLRAVSRQSTDRPSPQPMAKISGIVDRRQATAVEEDLIEVRLNEKGFLCITNVSKEEPKANGAAANTRVVQPVSHIPAFSKTCLDQGGKSTPSGLIIPADATVPRETSWLTTLSERNIRRHCDKQGTIHITNVVLTKKKRAMAATPADPGTALPLALDKTKNPSATLGQSPHKNANPSVIVRKDKGGRLHIYTKEPDSHLAKIPAPPELGAIDPSLAAIVMEAAQNYRLPASLILALIRLESNFSPLAVSPKGAMGLMQLMPGTAADLGLHDPFCPRENVMAGSRYLREMINCFNGSMPLAVAAYNAGPQRVVQAGYQIPEIKETKQFVSQVMGLQGLLEKSPMFSLSK